MGSNRFDARDQLTVNGQVYEVHRIDRISGSARLPIQPEGALGEPVAQRGTADWSLPSRSRRWVGGVPMPSSTPRSSTRRRGSCCRTSPGFRVSLSWWRCATQ